MQTTEIKVLDHGFVKYVEHWGSDERVIESARLSTQGGFVSWEPYEGHPKGDLGLLKYIWEKSHSTPFEMAGATFEIQAPIMVFREHHRHRTQSYSEASARYSPLPDVNYMPTIERCMRNGGKNKQAGTVDGAEELTNQTAGEWLMFLEDAYRSAERVYQYGLSLGVPKEIARLILPVGRYSKMRASANLLNWIKFLKLRYASDAQFEIAKFAEAVKQILTERFPRVMQLVNLPEISL